MTRSYRKIVLTRNQLRSLFNIPDEVDIRTAYVKTDPLSVQILLSADVEDIPWPLIEFDGLYREPEGVEDSESHILPHHVWQAWPSQ